ncbi:Bug family tripartite tricarboxylate transporter substrate binding protein [Achromobacter xylosoxidans]|uniref:Bug family tripartite tricarboxylate transporter substrate binding protein n=1 Tax=Alcaligenes xylosoxydans xylosoxydans TaxID=85698 RepID=UPI000B495591|nr:tripartite tricarboxylate transporter substrate binding protein [Achromobacter xylosoxidans]
MPHAIRLIAFTAVALTALGPEPARAASPYPDQPVRLIVPYPAGGAVDGAARILAERLSALWSQAVIVENRPGASGRIGLALAAKSPPSHTLVAATSSTLNEQLARGPDGAAPAAADLLPISTLFTTPVALLVNRQAVPAESLAQYVELARAKPGAVSFGSSGEGTTTHFFGELLKREKDIDITHIPFAGEGPNLSGLIGGHVGSAFLSASGATKAAQTGKTRVLAVTTPAGSPLLPGVPSFEQLGIAGLDRDTWVGLYAPPGTPQAVADRITTDVATVLSTSDVRERYAQLGLIAEGGSSRDLAARMEDDRQYWTRVVQQTGITLR